MSWCSDEDVFGYLGEDVHVYQMAGCFDVEEGEVGHVGGVEEVIDYDGIFVED